MCVGTLYYGLYSIHYNTITIYYINYKLNTDVSSTVVIYCRVVDSFHRSLLTPVMTMAISYNFFVKLAVIQSFGFVKAFTICAVVVSAWGPSAASRVLRVCWGRCSSDLSCTIVYKMSYWRWWSGLFEEEVFAVQRRHKTWL